MPLPAQTQMAGEASDIPMLTIKWQGKELNVSLTGEANVGVLKRALQEQTKARSMLAWKGNRLTWEARVPYVLWLLLGLLSMTAKVSAAMHPAKS